jgi:BMFP domain-containing protein YqiC
VTCCHWGAGCPVCRPDEPAPKPLTTTEILEACYDVCEARDAEVKAFAGLAADELDRLTKRVVELEAQLYDVCEARDAEVKAFAGLAADELDRLTKRVVELEAQLGAKDRAHAETVCALEARLSRLAGGN